MFESEKMTGEGVGAAEEDQCPGRDPGAEEELADPRPTHRPGERGAGVGEEAGTGAGADQGTEAASQDQEIGPGPGPALRRRWLTVCHK